jgi:hypothetical protein
VSGSPSLSASPAGGGNVVVVVGAAVVVVVGRIVVVVVGRIVVVVVGRIVVLVVSVSFTQRQPNPFQPRCFLSCLWCSPKS